MASLKQINEDISRLLLKFSDENQSVGLSDRLLWSYSRGTLEQLDKILQNNPDNLALNLKNYLYKNWEKINGTFLSYTSINESPIFNFLCDVAEFTAEKLNSNELKEPPVAPINLLMPTVATESIDENKHPNLGCYMDLDDQIKINSDLNIKAVLKTHILGEGGRYLIPVSLLPELLEKKEEKLANPYYDYKEHKELGIFISEKEMERLIRHSNSTQGLRELWLIYQSSLNNPSHLLGRLHILCQSLYMNSKDVSGSEEKAGSGVYSALLAFKDYYEELGEDIRNNIPEEVKKEVDLLLDISFNPESNEKATENLSSCVATRRINLLGVIQGNEKNLAQITLDSEKQDKFILSARENYEKAAKSLLLSFKENSYLNGRDQLIINSKLLKDTNIKLSISSVDDLQLFMSLSPEDIRELGKSTEGLDTQIMNQFKELDEFIILIFTAKPAVMDAILSINAQALAKKFLSTPQDFSSLLIIQDQERCRIICNALKKHLPDLIKSSFDFQLILKNLNNEQRVVVFSALREHILTLINNSTDYWCVCTNLNLDCRAEVYVAMSIVLPDFIKKISDLQNILPFMTIEQLYFDKAIQEKLIELIKNPRDFNMVSQFADYQGDPIIFNLVKKSLFEQIKDLQGFIYVAQHLNLVATIELCLSKKNVLTHFFAGSKDLFKVFKVLEPEVCEVLAKILKNSSSEIIKNEEELTSLYKQLSPEKKSVLSKVLGTSEMRNNNLFFNSNSQGSENNDLDEDKRIYYLK